MFLWIGQNWVIILEEPRYLILVEVQKLNKIQELINLAKKDNERFEQTTDNKVESAIVIDKLLAVEEQGHCG